MATNIHRLSFKQALKDAEENIYEGIDNATLSVETQGYLNMESAVSKRLRHSILYFDFFPNYAVYYNNILLSS